MADKDINERNIIKEALPNAQILISLFHVLRTFRREITCEKRRIISEQRNTTLEFLQKLAYASSEEDYNTFYSELKDNTTKEVFDYFESNWHCIRNEWVLHYKAAAGSFLNTTNNRLESLNAKLKQVIKHHSSLKDFFDNFFLTLSSLRLERDHKAAINFQKVKVSLFSKNSPETQYSELLTSYASAYVTKQLSLIQKVKNFNKCQGIYTVETTEDIKNVSTEDCDCLFRKSMMLPCRHIFALRKNLEMPLYDEALCDNRWTSEYYKETQRIFLNLTSQSSCSVCINVSAKPKLRQVWNGGSNALLL